MWNCANPKFLYNSEKSSLIAACRLETGESASRALAGKSIKTGLSVSAHKALWSVKSP
jgi:hypothetical protein